MNKVLKHVDEKIMLIPEILGYFVLSSDGKARIKHFPPSITISEIEIIGRQLVIMWDALKKSGIKEGMINWRYKKALLFIKSFSGGFILIFTSKSVNEYILNNTINESSEILSKNLNDEILDMDGHDTGSNIDLIVGKIKQKASDIAGPWMEYYFDEAVDTWEDIGKPKKSRLKELINLMGENIDEEGLREEFLSQALEIIKEN